MSITELKCFEKQLVACLKCSKKHCYKKCTNYIEPEFLLQVLDLAIVQQMELVKVDTDGMPILYLPRALARKTSLPPEKLSKLIKNNELDCPFLGKDESGKSLCRIYESRPEICRMFGAHPEINPKLACPNQGRKENIKRC